MKASFKVYRRRTQYYETDKMGIIHHSNYIRWFEEARIDFLEQIGFGYDRLEKMGVMIPVTSVICNYKSSVKFGDTVLVVPKIELFSGVKMTVSYMVRDCMSDELRVTGETGHCFVGNDFKFIRMKRDYPELYESLIEYVGVEPDMQ